MLPSENELLEKALEPTYQALSSFKNKGCSKPVIMDKARIIDQISMGDWVYKVTFHQTIEDEKYNELP